MIRLSFLMFGLLLVAVYSGCVGQESTQTYKNPSAISKVGENGDEGHHGPALELGSTTIGEWNVRATRDEGEVKAGGEAPVDVFVTGGTGKVAAVRFWIGTEDASGSVKSLAAIEDSAKQNWHAHAEVPSPLPEGSKLWVEVEGESGNKSLGSFDLKR
jgi:hypothetical protein